MKLTPISAPRQIHGEGFPEGKVDAPVGAIYTDTNATNGAIRWIKASGTGSTGWEVEYGDTGKRLLPKSLYSAGADQYSAADFSLWVRRYNDTVYLGGYFRLTEEQRDVVEVPAGFEFHGQGVVLSGSNTAGIDVGAMNVSGGSFRFINPKAPGNYLITPVALPAVSSWPVSLPGPEPDPGMTEEPSDSGLFVTTGLAENPAGSGLFDTPTSTTEDPDNPGLYLIGD